MTGRNTLTSFINKRKEAKTLGSKITKVKDDNIKELSKSKTQHRGPTLCYYTENTCVVTLSLFLLIV